MAKAKRPTQAKDLVQKFIKLYWRPPHYLRDDARILKDINKSAVVKKTELNEITPPEPSPVTEEESKMDPNLLKLLAWQQEILWKVVESLDEMKESIKQMKTSPEEAKNNFNESLKNSHFEATYLYEVYALKNIASDWSEERGLTGHQFKEEKDAEKYAEKQFPIRKWGKARYKIMKIKKPYLVTHDKKEEDK